MTSTDDAAGLSYDDQLTVRGKTYTVRAGCWSFGGDKKGDWVRVPVWSPSNGGATTVIVRDRDNIKTERRSTR